MNAFSRGPKNKKLYLWRCSCRGGMEFKNGRETPKTTKGGQCRWNRTSNPSCCLLLWDFTDRKGSFKLRIYI